MNSQFKREDLEVRYNNNEDKDNKNSHLGQLILYTVLRDLRVSTNLILKTTLRGKWYDLYFAVEKTEMLCNTQARNGWSWDSNQGTSLQNKTLNHLPDSKFTPTQTHIAAANSKGAMPVVDRESQDVFLT